MARFSAWIFLCAVVVFAIEISATPTQQPIRLRTILGDSTNKENTQALKKSRLERGWEKYGRPKLKGQRKSIKRGSASLVDPPTPANVEKQSFRGKVHIEASTPEKGKRQSVKRGADELGEDRLQDRLQEVLNELAAIKGTLRESGCGSGDSRRRSFVGTGRSIGSRKESRFESKSKGSEKAPYIVLFDIENANSTFRKGRTTADIRISEIGAYILDEEFKKLGEFRRLVRGDQWKTVGADFMEWIQTNRNNRTIIMSAHNGKRYDARILVFENWRHNIAWPSDIHHVDTLDVFPYFFEPVVGMNGRLGNYYTRALGGHIRNAHTALGDVKAMHDIMATLHPGDLLRIMKILMESIYQIQKRCTKSRL